ncbi:unnamed protein product [Paramecium pentaurelia]|uniref:Uncharacterized protein n=1 Tax=Paramecium pentaurelia TaxID=43138 RepID=A0A8S1WEM9_9CILI|nr:unnamed protein product [Paramecium pentaurelia]
MDQKENNNNDNLFKNIIFGNQVQNSYGNFRSFCAAIAHQDQINIIMDYIKTNEKFRRYNRFSYAYRVYEQQQFFVTQDKPGQEQQENRIIEGFHEDETLEGSGEKLLHLLQKFNVENVLIISAIQQYNPLYRFEPSHYRIIVERSKDLLNNLYTKVIQQEEEEQKQQEALHQQSLAQGKIIKVQAKLPKTQLEIPQFHQQAKFAKPEDRLQNRPGHFYAENPGFKPPKKSQQQQQQQQQQSQLPPISEQKKLKDLNMRLKNIAYQLEKILESLTEKEYLQFKFIAKYDQNKLVEKVLGLIMLIFDVDNRDQLATDFDIQNKLQNATVNDLTEKKVRKINETLRGDRRLNAYGLASVNPLISTIFAFIVLLIRSYEIGNDMLKITQSIAVQESEENQLLEDPI